MGYFTGSGLYKAYFSLYNKLQCLIDEWGKRHCWQYKVACGLNLSLPGKKNLGE